MSIGVDVTRRAAVGGLLGAAVAASARADVPAPTGAASDFDFLRGRWTAMHSKRLPDGGWADFPGTMMHRPLFGGSANAEEYRMEQPSGAYDALALRAFDPKARQWSIWWLDSRYPELGLGTPVRGGFAGDARRGLFFAPQTVDGKPGLLRFTWDLLPDGRARWEQSVSADGLGWAPNWRFTLTRA